MLDNSNYLERTPHALSHLSFPIGKIGRLQTLSWTPVLPGDGFELDLVGALRLSPLRRAMALDCVIDICSFYVPYRHVYGDDWVNFIEQGNDETVNLPVEAQPNDVTVNCLGVNNLSSSLPKWMPEGYRQIWNHYYRPVTQVTETTKPVTDWSYEAQSHGLRCAQLKSIWSATLKNRIDPSDYNVGSNTDSGSGAQISLLDIEKQLGHLRTEQEREYFNTRYRDIVSSFGGSTNYSADDRPELIYRSTFWASGFDINGTDQTSLGQFSGRVVQPFRHRVPRKFIPEHGTVWTLCLVRFPPLCPFENHYLVNHPNPSYAELAGDPEIVGTQPPHKLIQSDVFDTNSNSAIGYVPFGQHYRYQPPIISKFYEKLKGFPFLDGIPGASTESHLVHADRYDAMFQTTQLGHWQVHAKANVTAHRRLPSARTSLVTGA